jgi:hypothetical protein
MVAARGRDEQDDAAMSMTSELADAERRLAAMINHRADSEERNARADHVARVRADDARCQSLRGEYQQDFAAHGLEVPMARSDEWSGQFEKRLLRGLQRRLSPSSDLADLRLLDEVPSNAMSNFRSMIRDEAGREAHRPSHDNLPLTVDDPRAKFETTDPNTGHRQIEWRAQQSFIKQMNAPAQRVLRFVGKGGEILFGPPMDKVRR